VRRLTVVASVALTAVLALVAVPGSAGSRDQHLIEPISSLDFTEVKLDAPVQGPLTTIQPPDPGARSDGNLDQGSIMFEPALHSEPPEARVSATLPKPDRGSVAKNPWRRDPEISWYGPGLIGNGTACGQTLTRSLVGVAHRSLPCGTLITFRSHGHTVTMPVVDRGPFVGGRIFDLTYGACKKLEHCYTGPIEWRYGSR
jgi:hypothetical protein